MQEGVIQAIEYDGSPIASEGGGKWIRNIGGKKRRSRGREREEEGDKEEDEKRKYKSIWRIEGWLEVCNLEKGRRRITKSVSRAYRERGNSCSNFPKYTYQIQGKETKTNSTLLRDKKEHQD